MPVRIYDIAKKLGIESKQVLQLAKELGISGAKVPSSTLDKITAEYLEQEISNKLPHPVPQPAVAEQPVHKSAEPVAAGSCANRIWQHLLLQRQQKKQTTLLPTLLRLALLRRMSLHRLPSLNPQSMPHTSATVAPVAVIQHPVVKETSLHTPAESHKPMAAIEHGTSVPAVSQATAPVPPPIVATTEKPEIKEKEIQHPPVHPAANVQPSSGPAIVESAAPKSEPVELAKVETKPVQTPQPVVTQAKESLTTTTSSTVENSG